MAKGLSLHIGLNEVDPARYAGWNDPLSACEADATCMQAIAASLGYETQLLLTKDATRQRVSDAIRAAAARLSDGDIFLVSYAGHGGQVPDVNGDEADASDETWCLFDGQLIDDELLVLWKAFAPGVRVVVVSDSCHSGTVTRAARGQLDMAGIARELSERGLREPKFRFMPPKAARDTYLANKAFYDQLGRSVAVEAGEPAATVRLISGCQDDQVSADGTFNGLFTGTLLKVWDEGRFAGDYAGFCGAIVQRMPDFQRPNHLLIGPSLAAFDRQRPFCIEA